MALAGEQRGRVPVWVVDDHGRTVFDPLSLLESLEQITKVAQSSTSLAALLEGIHEATERFGVLGVVVWYVECDTLRLDEAAGYDEATLTRFVTLPLTANLPCTDAAIERRPVFRGDRPELFATYPLTERLVGRTHALSALNLERDGMLIGTMSLHFGWPVAFGASTKAFLSSLANLVAPRCHQAADLADVVPLTIVASHDVPEHDTWDDLDEHPPGSLLARLDVLERQMRKMRQLLQFLGAIADDRMDEGR